MPRQGLSCRGCLEQHMEQAQMQCLLWRLLQRCHLPATCGAFPASDLRSLLLQVH
jgi:hypothetical protein